MSREVLRAAGEQLLAQARAVRAAFPDAAAMAALPVGGVPTGCAEGDADVHAALGYLRDEARLVRAGRAGGVWVLDDEIAFAEGLLARP